MTQHDHSTYMDGCHRCEISREEVEVAKHHLTLMRGGGANWGNCSCGWRAEARTQTSVNLAFGEHLVEVSHA